MKERKKFEIIKKISEILFRLNPEKNVILTIVDLTLPQKGGIMKIYLSIFPEKKQNEVINYLSKLSQSIKEEMKKKIYLRYLPNKILFLPSAEFLRAQKIFSLIDEIKSSEKEKRDED